MSKHTPGPWLKGSWDILNEDRDPDGCARGYCWTFLESEYGNDFAAGPFGRKAKNPERIIDAAGYEADFAYFNNEADEKLFLAAPELLRLLKEAREDLDGPNGGRHPLTNEIEALIAKIEE